MAGQFLQTAADRKSLEQAIRGEFIQGHSSARIAMVGRSNVGKSSLINALLGTSEARISKQPGKTRAVHFYLWEDADRILVDLPGYGFAKASHEEKNQWAKFINHYLKIDPRLERALILLDSRHGPTKLDYEAIRFLSFSRIPVTFIFTKWDELKNQSERIRRVREAKAALKELGMATAEPFWVSSRNQHGIRELVRSLKVENGAF